ncbi:MAG: phosphatase PAP2 family protein [Thermodesulfobacteriota bacterium]
MLEDIVALDKSIFLAVNNGLSSPLFDVVMIVFSWFGSGYVLAGLIGLGLYIFDRKNFRRSFTIGIIAVLAGGMFVHVLKEVVARPRPLEDMADLILANRVHINIVLEPLRHSSFPSGDTQTAFGAAMFLAYTYRKYVTLLFVVAFITGMSRIYVGVHYPSDVLAGGLIGTLTSFVVCYFGYRYFPIGKKKREL